MARVGHLACPAGSHARHLFASSWRLPARARWALAPVVLVHGHACCAINERPSRWRYVWVTVGTCGRRHGREISTTAVAEAGLDGGVLEKLGMPLLGEPGMILLFFVHDLL